MTHLEPFEKFKEGYVKIKTKTKIQVVQKVFLITILITKSELRLKGNIIKSSKRGFSVNVTRDGVC